MPLRIIFMGTPDFSVPVLLRALHAAGTRSWRSIRSRRGRRGGGGWS